MAPIELLGEEPSPRKTEDVCPLNPDGVEESCRTIRPVAYPNGSGGLDDRPAPGASHAMTVNWSERLSSCRFHTRESWVNPCNRTNAGP